MMLLPLFFACHLYAILSAASSVTFPAIAFKELLVPSTTNSTNDPVPVECQQTCAPIVPLTLGNQSCTPSLCCNSTWEQAYYSCILCAAQIQQITDLSNAQHTLDMIYADCTLVGSPIPLLTFPGQSPNRPLPSASVPSQSTATATNSGNLTSSPSTSTAGSSTNSSLLPSSTILTASLTASPATTSTQNSGSSTRNQLSIVFAAFIISIAFSYL